MAELDLDAIEMRGPSPDESNIMCKELRAHRAAREKPRPADLANLHSWFLSHASEEYRQEWRRVVREIEAHRAALPDFEALVKASEWDFTWSKDNDFMEPFDVRIVATARARVEELKPTSASAPPPPRAEPRG